MFSALTIIEGIWDLGFFSKLLLNKEIPGVATYAFTSNYPRWEFFITIYHLLIVPIVIFALFKIKKIHSMGWLGASIFTAIVSITTYLFVRGRENINCIYKVDYCQNFLKPLYQFSNPFRIFLGILFLTIFLFAPLNYLILKLGERTFELNKKNQSFQKI